MKLVYFAWLRERLGQNEETVDLPKDVISVSDLFTWLQSRDALYQDVFEHENIIQVALDQKHVRDRSASIRKANEIALFPPMTGG